MENVLWRGHINGDMSDTLFSLISVFPHPPLTVAVTVFIDFPHVPDSKLGAPGRVWNKSLQFHRAGVCGEGWGYNNNVSFRVESVTGK